VKAHPSQSIVRCGQSPALLIRVASLPQLAPRCQAPLEEDLC